MRSSPLAGRRYGPDYPSQASVAPSPDRLSRGVVEFDLNRHLTIPSAGPNLISHPPGSSRVQRSLF